MADAVVSGLLVLLAVVAVVLVVVGVRHRLAFRIGIRNAARARQRTALLVAGLLIATSIIGGSLVVGDTIDTVAVHYTILAAGHNDEVIGNRSASGGYSYFPYSVYTGVQNATVGDGRIAGMAPEVVDRVSILDQATGEPQPLLYLIGVNGNQSAQLGSFVADNGTTIAGPVPGEVLLDDLAASEINASAGDRVLVYGATPRPTAMEVQAVVQDNLRGAFPTGGLGNYGSAFVTLSTGQRLENQTGQINFLTVTNSGDQSARLANAAAVSATLNATLASLPGAKGLFATPLFQQALDQEETAGSSVAALFLVLGLFSIAAGVLLIVGIFLLLAEERKPEMGLLRALGMRGSELLYVFLAEGAIYSAGSALAGTALGVGIGYGLTYAFSVLLGGTGIPSAVLLGSYTVTPSSLLLAYTAGFLLTLGTVYAAVRRVSRLNIVRAVHDLPEPDPPVRTYTLAAVIGSILAALGLLLYLGTYRGTTPLTEPILGGVFVLAGTGLVAARFVKNRWAFSAMGVGLLAWAGDAPLHAALLGARHSGGIDTVFVEGITLVAGAVLVYVFNAPAISDALIRLIGGRTRRAPIARVALSYPGRRPARTTINLTIFALVTFTLVTVAGVGSSLDASLSDLEANETGGYSLLAISGISAPELPGLVAANLTLASYFAEVVPLATAGIAVTENGSSLPPYDDAAYAAPANESSFANFYATNHYTFLATLNGWSAAQVFAALATQPNVALVDRSYSTVANTLGSGPPPGHPTVDPGGTLTLGNPLTGNRTTVTVVGVLTETVLSGVFVGPTTAAALGITQQQVFLMGLAPGVSASAAITVAKRAFFPYGLIVIDLDQAIATSIATTEGEISLLQIFVALGLVVGIAAMGIVALRAVTERRREIGMLRANGFTQGMVIRAFLLEYSFVTLVGLAIGTLLGLLVVWNLVHSPEGGAANVNVFAMPWTNLVLILGGAYALAMLAVARPSRAAARLAPATAVRATE